MNSDQKIVIVDYGMGNLHSVKRKLDHLRVNAIISSDSSDILNADKLILPGVGHFGKAMENLQKLDLIQVLHEVALVRKTPVLGICLGMQLMAKSSEEGDVSGLGWFDAEVIRFRVNDKLKHKVPHTGWNQVEVKKESRLMQGMTRDTEFYFVHSYHVKTEDSAIILNETEYEYKFISALEKENIFGVQYHPEKSHEVGEKLIENFLRIRL